MKKKLLIIFTTILLAITALTCNVFADGSGTSSDPWQIGTSGHESDVTAYLDDGTLYVEGSGAMVDFLNSSSMPWYDSRYSITKVIIGEGITRIGDYSFRTHTYLSNIEISSTVTSIGYYSFDNCASNATITVKAVTPPTIAFNSFDPLASFDLHFYVPYYSVSSYQSASNWNQFPNYHAIPLTIADILPDNFPITEATGWTNGNEYIYNFSGYNQIKIGGV